MTVDRTRSNEEMPKLVKRIGVFSPHYTSAKIYEETDGSFSCVAPIRKETGFKSQADAEAYGESYGMEDRRKNYSVEDEKDK